MGSRDPDVAEPTSVLHAWRRRPAARAVIARLRPAEPLFRRAGAGVRHLAARAARLRLFVRALPERSRIRTRRDDLLDALGRLPEPAVPTRSVSVVIVSDAHRTPPDTGPAPVELVAIAPVGGESVAAAAARGGAVATGELVCFLAGTSKPLEPGWLSRLSAEIGDGVVAATSLLVHPQRGLGQATPHDVRVRELGLDVCVSDEGVPAVRSRLAGRRVSTDIPPVPVAAASGACLLVDRSAYEAAGGLTPLDDLDAAAIELCCRLRANGGRVVAVARSVVEDRRPVHSMRALTSPVDPCSEVWRRVVDRHGPALIRGVRPPAAGQLRVALTVAAPSAKVATLWGDWHLAHALARSLRRLGHFVLVQTADRADDPAGRSCDIHVVFRGLQPIRPTSGQRQVLWVISHPEALEIDECDGADLVLVASERFAAHLAARTATPVDVLLQATDHRRFRPRPPNPAHARPVAVVAKTRGVLRPVVADAIAAGLRPAIYGAGWKEFVDPDLVVTDHVPNAELPEVYSSVGVLLNDHWGTMRDWGFVSNRLFDALGCATPVVSDDLPEVQELFGDAVATYRDPDDLRRLVDTILRNPDAARARAADGRQVVLAAHTFDHRAQRIVELLERHGLAPGAPTSRAGDDEHLPAEQGPDER
jgi:hypothetical protein